MDAVSGKPVSTFSGRSAAPAVVRRVRAAMDRDGVAVLEGLFPRALLSRARAEVLRRHESGELRARGLVRDIAGRYTAVLPFRGPFLEPAFYANPRLRAVADAMLGASWCFGSLEAIMALPGAVRQYQHVDAPLRLDRVVAGRSEGYRGVPSDLPPYALALATPLCDVDEVNGPTAIWPGSHRDGLAARLPSEARISRAYPRALMTGRFGFSYLYDYRTFHRGMPNDSREVRPLLMLVLTRSWFRDPNLSEVSPRIVLSERDWARLPPKRRPLFQLAAPARRPLWQKP